MSIEVSIEHRGVDRGVRSRCLVSANESANEAESETVDVDVSVGSVSVGSVSVSVSVLLLFVDQCSAS